MTLSQNELYALVLAAVLIVALIAVVAWANAQRRRKQSLRLQQRFGPEYVRLSNELGRTKAEAELAAREKRVATLTLRPLPAAEAAKFRRERTTALLTGGAAILAAGAALGGVLTKLLGSS